MAPTKEAEQNAVAAVACPECRAPLGVGCFFTARRARKNHRYAEARPSASPEALFNQF